MYPNHLHTDRRFPDEIIAIPHQDKQVIEVILLKQEILHDIEDGIRDLDRNRDTNLPDLLPEGADSSYMLRRHIDTAVNQAVSRCQAYLLLPSPFVHRISTNHAGDWEEKSIYLAMPRNWPPHLIDSLRDSVHNYIVDRAIQLFLRRKDQNASQVCDAQATVFWNEINTALNARLGPMRCHPTFLG